MVGHAESTPVHHCPVPYLRMTGKFAEACAVRVDGLWDTTEGRMIPEPVQPHDRSHDRRIAQYFFVDPHLPDD